MPLITHTPQQLSQNNREDSDDGYEKLPYQLRNLYRIALENLLYRKIRQNQIIREAFFA